MRRDTEYSERIRRDTDISPYSVRMRENMDQNNSKYGYFLHSDCYVVSYNVKNFTGWNIFSKFADLLLRNHVQILFN